MGLIFQCLVLHATIYSLLQFTTVNKRYTCVYLLVQKKFILIIPAGQDPSTFERILQGKLAFIIFNILHFPYIVKRIFPKLTFSFHSSLYCEIIYICGRSHKKRPLCRFYIPRQSQFFLNYSPYGNLPEVNWAS